MSTLLIELSGPQQSWGTQSRFATRATDRAPSKSGVVGLLASALGMDRTQPLDRFQSIHFGVRIDQPGRVDRDFQTTRSLDGRTAFPLSQRYYLADAVFLVGIETDDGELAAYQHALAHPCYPLFLGRRAFPPDGPLRTHLVQGGLREALAQAPWAAHEHHRREFSTSAVDLDVIVDADAGSTAVETRQDVPTSFDPRRRQYGIRDVETMSVSVPHPDPPAPRRLPTRRGSTDRPPGTAHGDRLLGSPTDHDPGLLLADEEV